MTIHLDVWSDFVCPFCYAVSLSLKKLDTSHDIALRWRSYELRPAGSPPIPPEYLARIQAGQPQLARMMMEQHDVVLKQGKFGTNSRPALIGDKYAEAKGVGALYHAAVNDVYWLEGRAIDDLAVLSEIAESAGLERAAFLAALGDPAYEAQVDRDVEQARVYGFSGVPALIFEEKYLVSGARPYEFLAEVVDKLALA